jgi:hypothetical protein
MLSPSEIRDSNWQQISGHMHGLRQVVYEALRMHGPCTTRQLAAKAGMDILSVRPRVTELAELGFAACSGREDKEGIYRACTYQQAATAHAQRQSLARGEGVQDGFDFAS